MLIWRIQPCHTEYFRDKENLVDIVGKWALISTNGEECNELSYPFWDHFNKEVRVEALDISEDPFSGAFKHVAPLARYSLLLDHSKDKPPSGCESLVSKVHY